MAEHTHGKTEHQLDMNQQYGVIPRSEIIEELVPIINEISLARDMETLMPIIRKAARKFTGADGACFILREDNLCFYVDEEAVAPLWRGQRFNMENCISGWVMLNQEAAVIEDIETDERIPREFYTPTFVKSLVMVPIRSTSPIGAIGAYWATKYSPPPEVVKILQSLADLASSAIRNIELYDEMKQTRDALERSEELLREMVDSIPVGVWVSDSTGEITMVNQMAEHIWRGKKLIGMNEFHEFKGWWADSGKRIEPHEWALARAINKGETSLNEEIQIESFDGKRKTILNSAVPIRGKDGRIVAGIAINQDITERKKAEEALRKAHDELEFRVRERTAELQRAYDALRQSEEKYRELVENANSIILRMDEKGCITFFNEFAQKFFGYTEEEVLGRHVIGTIVPERESSGSDLAECIEKIFLFPKQCEHNENENIKRSGERVWISWTNRAFYDETGAIAGVLSIGNDITDRRRAEVALSRANRALMTLSRCNEVLVRAASEKELLDQVCKILVDTGGYLMAWVGYAEHDNEKIIRPVAQAGFESGYLNSAGFAWGGTDIGSGPGGTAIKTGEPCVVKNILNDPKFAPWRDEAMKRGYASTVSIPLYFEGDTPSGILAIYAGESDAFDSEEMKLLLNLADDLSFGIASLRNRAERERVKEKLGVYTAKLEQRNRELEDFAFISSHHVQEPLRKILTFSDRLKSRFRDTLDPESEDHINRMLKSVRRIQALIGDLLKYSRISDETEGFAPVDLSAVVQEALSDLAGYIGEAGTRVDLSDLPTIEASRRLMRKLFSQLIENAVKFRDKNAPAIRIYSRTRSLAGKEYIDIYVEDNGIGFEEKYIDRIFIPFQQLHGKDKYEGTGMGLAICRRIVDLHSGSITARSTPGKGATFIISLPVNQERREKPL